MVEINNFLYLNCFNNIIFYVKYVFSISAMCDNSE